MEMFKVWLMPEDKFKGSEDKWIEQDMVEAKCRKDITKTLREKHKSGSWKVRKI